MDKAAIEAAVRELGITSNVRIAWSNGTRTLGCHRYVRGTHRITVSTNSCWSVSDFSETLWHELQHAADCDRLGVHEFARQYRMHSRMGYGWSRAYEANPFERAARDRGASSKYSKPLGHGLGECRPSWYGSLLEAIEVLPDLDVLEQIRRAKNCLASTKSLLKKAIREGNLERANHLEKKQVEDEQKIRDLEALR